MPSNLGKPVATMSGPVPPFSGDDFVLPIPTLHAETLAANRKSTDSSRSQILPEQRLPDGKKGLQGVWRHTIGIMLLLATVILWTASNFLASVSGIETLRGLDPADVSTADHLRR